MKAATIINDRFLAYLLLVARVLLAWMLIAYGSGKVLGGQFGVTPETLTVPLKDVDLFRLSWYMADHEPFKSFIGISQILAALLLLWTRTKINRRLYSCAYLVKYTDMGYNIYGNGLAFYFQNHFLPAPYYPDNLASETTGDCCTMSPSDSRLHAA